MAERKYLEALTRRLADEGKLIEAGWVGMRMVAIPLDAPAAQLEEMRLAYMAGAQHLWGSIMTMLDPDIEETEDDMRRMELISKELQAFVKEMELKIARPKGYA